MILILYLHRAITMEAEEAAAAAVVVAEVQEEAQEEAAAEKKEAAAEKKEAAAEKKEAGKEESREEMVAATKRLVREDLSFLDDQLSPSSPRTGIHRWLCQLLAPHDTYSHGTTCRDQRETAIMPAR